MELQQLVEFERGFWVGDAEFYRQHLAEDFLMLFPGVGLMGRAQAIESIEGGQRWTAVEIQDQHLLNVGPDTRLLCYEAKARRQGSENYSALVSSAYVHRGDTWKLAFHQHSPLG